ncbi:phosphoribosylformylglycinamidine synthase subunit PurQ [Candidatus Methylacidithermus pantelleriae]|uniref:Phosphoribosylformylglycinamidine synthase subunit PurQ n=1 Tax=Candidatus Methylacidithermus pantelleriae TaxID=2744239 RepID=A0A8J2BTB9_9BACT|nr:phosphoribosylformylglycinamidine synthase subunit PurQ [Candidatus Methylacidithermus pantelleriae]CAF0698804.1 Phosphoribosylformylglycinamidine synthase subunit PurQ [Candidatus Methylacidithermus pantelleriae]
MRWGIVRFPGSNCDRDCYYALGAILSQDVFYLWHEEEDLHGADAVILPGGFSYGDYLRCGAIARFSPILKSVIRAAEEGKLVLGICNGFQILCEARLLPGALLPNVGLRFRCRPVWLRVENTRTPFSCLYSPGEVIRMPIAHGQGRYYVGPALLEELRAQRQILFRYCAPSGEVSESWNPNGSVDAIAGVCNASGNVAGLMPHPERACEELLGSEDGRKLFASMIEWWRRQPTREAALMEKEALLGGGQTVGGSQSRGGR